MTIRKHSLPISTISAWAIIVSLLFPCVAKAISIGEVVSQSKLGQPLLVQVGLTLGSGEQVEASCLSLIAPDANEDDTSGYVTKASLSIKSDGNRHYIVISSRQILDDAFARLRLQIKCSGLGSVIKTLTILPDLDASVPQAQIASPNLDIEAGQVPVSPVTDRHTTIPNVILHTTRDVHTEVKKLPVKKSEHIISNQHVRLAPEPTARHTEYFRLKLSSDPIDESRIGKISQQEREVLLARQKMLDSDEQTARFLAIQHQVKQLQDELGQIRLQLSQLSVNPNLAGMPPKSASAPTVGRVNLPVNQIKPAVVVKPLGGQQEDQDLQYRLIIALVLLLMLFALWFALRYFAKRHAKRNVPDDEARYAHFPPVDSLDEINRQLIKLPIAEVKLPVEMPELFTPAVTVETLPADKPITLDDELQEKNITNDFVFETTSKSPMLDLEFEITESPVPPPSGLVEPLSTTSPEFNLDFLEMNANSEHKVNPPL